jgi:hypothetical protein
MIQILNCGEKSLTANITPLLPLIFSVALIETAPLLEMGVMGY